MNNTTPDMEQTKRLQVLSQMVGRMNLASKLGMSFGGDRDLYQALGYKKDLIFTDYFAQYKRHDIAKAIIDRPVKKTWEGQLLILEAGEAEDTQLEKQWKQLQKDLKLKAKFTRLDKLTGLGRYGVLLLGFNDVQKKEDFTNPVKGTNLKLMYVKPLSEEHAKIHNYENDATNPRYGKPLYYDISTVKPESQKEDVLRVHFSRVLHVVDDPLLNEVEGTPRLEAVFNRLQDLEKLTGGSAEMFWRGARPGHAAEVDKDYTMTEDAEKDLKSQIDEYEHNLRRILLLEGTKLSSLDTQISDPSAAVDVQIQMVSAETGIPKRILVGSERGELASSEDKNQFNSLIQSRREEFAESEIVRPFIDVCMLHGALPKLAEESYDIQWQDLYAPSDKEKAEVGKIRADALKAYASEISASGIVPPKAFFQYFLGLNDEEIELIEEMMQDFMEQEEEDEVTEEERELIDQEETEVTEE